MQTIVLYLCYIVLILLFSSPYNTSLIYCFVIWCLHTNKRRPCSSTLSGHPSSSSLKFPWFSACTATQYPAGHSFLLVVHDYTCSHYHICLPESTSIYFRRLLFSRGFLVGVWPSWRHKNMSFGQSREEDVDHQRNGVGKRDPGPIS